MRQASIRDLRVKEVEEREAGVVLQVREPVVGYLVRPRSR